MTQTPAPTIRRGTIADAGLLSELGARTFSETFAADNTPDDLAAYIATSFNIERQTAELEDPASTFLIAEVDGRAAVTRNSMMANLSRESKALTRSSWSVCMCCVNGSDAASANS